MSCQSRWLWLFPLVALAMACEDEATAPRADQDASARDHDHAHDHDHDLQSDSGASASLDASPDEADADSSLHTDWMWELPKGFPTPVVPEDNPMSRAKVLLGRHLFYDERLSRNETQSCASCHHQELAFTDGRAQAMGSTGALHPRNSMSIVNVAYAATLTWANPLVTTLERQALVPIFGDAPIELGQTSTEALEQRLRDIPEYAALFGAAFSEAAAAITLEHAAQALASFERTIISGHSAYDRWSQGEDPAALNDSARRGYQLFNSEKLECFHCHVGFNLTDHISFAGKPFVERPYHNTGLYNIDSKGAYPAPNTGVHNVTGQANDMGRFKAPSLRNVAVTAPYMHDGSIATLSEVLDHYAAGGRTITSGPYAGNGSRSPLKDPLIRGFMLNAQERADVIEFLKSLTDDELLTNPELSNPW